MNPVCNLSSSCRNACSSGWVRADLRRHHENENNHAKNPSHQTLITAEEPGEALQCIPRRILDAPDGALDLAFDLVRAAVGLQLGIACRLADGLLDGALELLRRSGDPILIHDNIPLARRTLGLGVRVR